MRGRPRRLRKRVTRLLVRVTGPAFIWLAALSLRLLGRTWRLEIEGENPLDEGGAAVGAVWHRDMLIAAYAFRDLGYSVPVSRSRDGDTITRLLLRLGYAAPPRGSSSAGGASALRGLVRLVRDGTPVSLPVDGPRGPERRSKVGVVSLSRLTGVPITPYAFSARPCLRFGSWDRTLLPLPFARVTGCFGTPLAVPLETTPEGEEQIARELDGALDALADALDARMGMALSSPAPTA